MDSLGNLFRSKVAWRVFILFILSSLVPVVILAALSLYHVSSISSSQVASRLEQDSKIYGLSVYDRLQVVEEELLFHTSMLDVKGTLPATDYRDLEHITSWNVSSNDDIKEYPQRDPSLTPAFETGAIEHMLKGRSVLSVVHQESVQPLIFMSRIVNLQEMNSRILTAQINQNYLWGDQDRFSEDISACVLGASYQYIHCSNSVEHLAGNALREGGRLTPDSLDELLKSEEMFYGRWALFMQPNYFTSKWNIVLFQNRQEAYFQLKQFAGIYLIVLFMFLLIVSLFSIYLIRRNSVPLEALMKGIRKISENEFSAKVKVDSHDEYEEVANALNSMSLRIGNQIKRLETQAYVDRLILSRPSVDDIVDISYHGINELVSCNWVELALLEDAHSCVFHLRGAAVAGDEKRSSRYLTCDRELIDSALQGEPILLSDPTNQLFSKLRQLNAPDIRNYLLLPILNVDELYGIFILGFQCEPLQEDIEDGMEFSNRIAVAFANAAWEERLYNQARYDLLTSLPNRASLEERLEQEISHASRAKECIAVLFLDLDRFKNVNDSLGHEFGDAVLKKMSNRLHRGLREEDTISRHGGDEFIIMLRGLEDQNTAVSTSSVVAEKIIELISKPIILDEHEIRMTTSIGISVYPTDAKDMSTLLRNADSAMYHAKDLGRGNFQFYSEELNAAANYRLEMETKLHRALEQDEFELFYQPKYDIKTNKIISCEALIRWRDEDGSMISPDKFIAVAEDIGLTTVIGQWALLVACKQARKWSLPVSVNISARHFHHGNLIEHVADALNDAKLDPAFLEIEITETTTMQNLEKTVSVLTALKEIGVKISIDDFGTGYSSLNYLKHFPVDTLKIDRIFIKNILLHDKDLAIVKSTVGLAHNLGLNVVAEGVELEEQRTTLEELGCDEMQGFLFSHALPPKDFLKFFKSSIKEH